MALMLSSGLNLPSGGSSSGSSGWGGFWDALGTVGSATLGYLANKDALKTQRDIAKQASGGGGSDMLLSYLLATGGVARPTAAPIQFAQQPMGTLSPLQLGGGPTVAAPYVNPTAWNVQGQAGSGLPQPSPQTGVMLQPSPFAGYGYGGRGGGIINAPQVFNTTNAGYRAKSFFAVANPNTGNLTWFRSAGKPILFSGDLRACKRVNKVASRARRASPRKTVARRKR